jgi:hypothetical protein
VEEETNRRRRRRRTGGIIRSVPARRMPCAVECIRAQVARAVVGSGRSVTRTSKTGRRPATWSPSAAPNSSAGYGRDTRRDVHANDRAHSPTHWMTLIPPSPPQQVVAWVKMRWYDPDVGCEGYMRKTRAAARP